MINIYLYCTCIINNIIILKEITPIVAQELNVHNLLNFTN